jgi:beta-glucosidase/6-phospho-beta-glucosidase/beta-galactosidase
VQQTKHTFSHCELPGCHCELCPELLQVLQDQYQGLIGEEFIADFVNYANVLFENFGDRIRDWMTFNEPWVTCVLQVGWV